MLAGPIYRVELLATARRSRYFVLRVVYALLVLLVLFMSYQTVERIAGGGEMSIQQASRLASTFFIMFSWVQLLAILAVAPAMVVGTISSERERRTIEYLFATDLSNTEIILGKTLARLTLIGKLLLVALPILLLFRLMGGIPADLLFSAFLIGGSTALLVTAISICVSVWSERSRDGINRVYLLLAALLFLPMILVVFSGPGSWLSPIAPALNWMLSINPLVVQAQAMGSRFGLGAGFDFDPILHMVAWHVGISAACIALATAAVRRVHLRDSGRSKGKQEDPREVAPAMALAGQAKIADAKSAADAAAAAAAAAATPVAVAPPVAVTTTSRSALKGWRPALGDRPMLWKEAFAGTARGKLGWVGNLAALLILMTVFGVALWAFGQNGSYGRGSGQYFAFLTPATGLIGTGVLLMLASRAAGLVTVEKERDCWLSLLSTPLSSEEIIRGKILGNLYSVRWAFVLLLSIWALGMLLHPLFLVAVGAMTLSFAIGATFASTLGVFYSLRAATTLKASGTTLLVLLFVGGGYLACCCPLAGMSGTVSGGQLLAAMMMAPCLPYLLAAPAGLGFWELGDGIDEHAIPFIFAYFAGLIGYAMATFALYRTMVDTFDEVNGRTGRRGSHSGTSRPGVSLPVAQSTTSSSATTEESPSD